MVTTSFADCLLRFETQGLNGASPAAVQLGSRPSYPPALRVGAPPLAVTQSPKGAEKQIAENGVPFFGTWLTRYLSNVRVTILLRWSRTTRVTSSPCG